MPDKGGGGNKRRTPYQGGDIRTYLISEDIRTYFIRVVEGVFLIGKMRGSYHGGHRDTTYYRGIENIINRRMERAPLIMGRTESIIDVGAEEVYIIRVNTRAPPLTGGSVHIL